jgi:outer membrane protein OmpA-like peptidoglycan-associated protein
MNYLHHGSTKIEFQEAASPAPSAHGSARIENDHGPIRISGEFKDLAPPSAFGPEYLTYVLWAIPPNGSPVNLGEVNVEDYGAGSTGKIETTCNFPAFGLIVTAEPYYAVNQPSNAVALQNAVRLGTRMAIEAVNVVYQTLPTDAYLTPGAAGGYAPVSAGKKYPLELYEAQNAVRLAGVAGAARYAPKRFQDASAALQRAEQYQVAHPGRAEAVAMAREAVTRAEAARIVAVGAEREESLDKAREAASQREEAGRKASEEAARRADRAEAQADRAAAERITAEALEAVQQAKNEQLAAERAKNEAEAARQRAEKLGQQTQLRGQLLDRLNATLPTRESSRGFIVSMPNAYFDNRRSTLTPDGREKLAQVAAALANRPGLKIRIEGHADTSYDEDYDRRLSENRAASVRDCLAGQGVNPANITALGLGRTQASTDIQTEATQPISNGVEIVISGDAIGFPVGQSKVRSTGEIASIK